jgi:hypothetical protein
MEYRVSFGSAAAGGRRRRDLVMAHERAPGAAAVVARDELPSGIIVSTVELPGPTGGFESMAFAPGWPATGDALASARNRYLREALLAHRTLLERFGAKEVLDTSEPGWVFRMMGLPLRRFPRGRPDARS